MRGKATFSIIGKVGKVVEFDKLTKVAVAADYPSKDDDGEWHNNTHWNTVSVFAEATRKWLGEQLKPGDLVTVEGRMRENQYKKDGRDVYTVDLVAESFTRLATKEQLASTQGEDQQDQAA